jgi:streptogramin lyase
LLAAVVLAAIIGGAIMLLVNDRSQSPSTSSSEPGSDVNARDAVEDVDESSTDVGIVGEAVVLPGEQNQLSIFQVVSFNGDLWVSTAWEDGRIRRIDPATRRVIDSVFVAKRLSDLDVGHGAIWALDQAKHRVARIDPATMHVRFTRLGDVFTSNIAMAPDGVWISGGIPEEKATHLTKLASKSGRVLTRFQVPHESSELTYAANTLWLLDDQSGTVTQVDPRSGRSKGGVVELGALDPRSMGAAGSHVIITGMELNRRGEEQISFRIILIKSDVAQIRASLPTTPNIPTNWTKASGLLWITFVSEGLITGESGAWESQPAFGQLQAVDPRTLDPIGEPIRVGPYPDGLAFADGALWVTDSLEHTLRRVEPTTAGSDEPPPLTPADRREARILERVLEAGEGEPSE